MRLPSVGIFGRVLVVVLLAFGVVLVTFGVLALQAVAESTERTMQERLLLTKMAAGRVDDRLRDLQRLMQVMIVTDRLEPENNDRAAQMHFLRSIREHLGPFAHYIFIVDHHLNVIAADPMEPALLDYDYAARQWLIRVFDTGEPVITRGLFLGGASPLVAIIVPTTWRDGQNNGAVFAALDLRDPSFASILQPLGLGETGYTQIVDSTGLVLAASAPAQFVSDQDHRSQFATLIEKQKTMVGTCYDCHGSVGHDVHPREDIMAFAPLQSAPWGMVLRQSRAEAFAYSDTLRERSLLLAAVALAVAAGTTWLLTRQLVRPLQALTKACQKIADGNWSVIVPRGLTGELDQLARAFDFMRERLMAFTERLQGWTAELETAVRERTEALEESSVQLCQANQRLATLNALGDALRQTIDIDDILSIALDKVVLLVHALGGSACVFDEANGMIVISRHSANLESYPPCGWETIQPILKGIAEGGAAHVTDVAFDVCSSGQISPRADGNRAPLACIPLQIRGRNLGVLLLVFPCEHTVSPAELDLLSSIGGQIGIAIENALLIRDLREKESARAMLLRKVIGAQEEERRRIARELHDETSQTLTAVSVGLEATIRAPASNVEQVKQRLVPIKGLATGMLEEVQRMVRDLRPSLLDDIGLISAIDWYSETRLKRYGVQVGLEVAGTERRLPTELETTIFRLAQEAISNIAKHSGAENVNMVLDFGDKSFVMEIDDDGKGFQVGRTFSPDGNNVSFGLIGMRERIDLFGGTLSVNSQLNEGTSIRIELPIPVVKGNGNGQAPDQNPIG